MFIWSCLQTKYMQDCHREAKNTPQKTEKLADLCKKRDLEKQFINEKKVMIYVMLVT